MAAVLQYDRGARLTILPPQDLGGPVALPLTFNPRPPVQGQAAEPQLTIDFSISKSLTPAPNGGTIRIYNLAQRSRDTIAGVVRSIASWRPKEAVVKVDGVLRAGGSEVTSQLAGMAGVILEAGWSGALQRVIAGTATNVRSYRQGTDRITEIQVTDGGFQLTRAVAARTFPPGTPALAVVEYLATTLGLGLAPTQGLAALGGFTLVAGLAAYGDCQQGIQDCCDALQLQWWVEDGLVWILGDGESLPGQPLVVSPELIPGAIRLYREPEPVDGQGLRLECALAPEMRCGHLVVVAASEQRGTYRVEAVQHGGRNVGGPFGSTAVVRDPVVLGL